MIYKPISKRYTIIKVYLFDIGVDLMAKENKTIYAILGLLNHEGMTGYDIKKRIDNSLKFFWDASFGQIYPSLKTLEEKGWVISKNHPGKEGPERIYYSITNEGRKHLIEWLSTPVEKEQVKYEILLKLFFGSAIEPKENIKNIKEFKERNLKLLQLFQVFKNQLEQVINEDDDHTYFYLTVLFGEKIQRAYLEWADEAVGILNKLDQNDKK